jgi:PAS domain S-box-containing protein
MGSEARDATPPKTHFDSRLWERAKNPAAGIAEAVANGLLCDEVIIVLDPVPQGASNITTYSRGRGLVSNTTESLLFDIRGRVVAYKSSALALPLVVNDINRARLPTDLAARLIGLGVKSFGLFKLEQAGQMRGYVACLFKRGFHRWRSDEISAFESLATALPALENARDSRLAARERVALENKVGKYQRLAEHGNVVMLTTDKQFGITDVFGNSKKLIGIEPAQMIGDSRVWERFVDPRDGAALKRRIKRLRVERNELNQEIRVIHQETREVRWLLLRALPQFSAAGDFLGWEGLGLDVTERREAQNQLERQNERLGALFEISATLTGYHDPSWIALTGLSALIRATHSDAGYACVINQQSGHPEMVAAKGLSEDYIDGITPVLTGQSLLKDAIDQNRSFLVEDLQAHPKAYRSLAESEGLRGTIIVPLSYESKMLGALVVFKREVDFYSEDDLELVTAAAAQIALAITQGEVLNQEKRQSASYRSLYQVSHGLAKHRAATNFTEEIIPAIRDEFGLKRCWIGIMNEQGSFLVGRAGFGDGLEAMASQSQIEINTAPEIIRDVIQSRTPRVIWDPNTVLNEPLTQMFSGARNIVIAPMVTIGKVMGLIVVEPHGSTALSSTDRLELLMSMAGEMATAMMAGRFESKMAEALRMRMAGLLASGIAHNFNNFLQAIMGQVSLIEMQTPNGSPIRDAARNINEAASKGAGIVAQLMSFTTKGANNRTPITVQGVLEDAYTMCEPLLPDSISFSLDFKTDRELISLGDTTQLQQVITNMVINAKDAIDDAAGGKITLALSSVTVRAGELAPDIVPGTYAKIDIQDNGCGMTTEQQARCFEPFYTTKNIDHYSGVGLSGSGLGLSAAYSLIKDHEGAITLHSKEGEGTLFSIYLPLQTESRASDSSASAISASISAGGALMLGVESGAQPFISSSLEAIGFISRVAFDRRQVDDIILREPNRWSVIILDPEGLAGQYEVIKEDLLARYPEIKLITLGGSNGKQAGSTAGSRHQYLEKPVTVWGLERVLTES